MIGPQPAGERVLLPRAGTGKPQAAAAASLWRRNAVTWTSSVPKRDGGLALAIRATRLSESYARK